MRKIGGELEVKKLPYSLYFTDSGRSSLRLFIRSGNQNRKFLLPNFFCSVIENVLKEEGICYEFYEVNNDLSINQNSILKKEYDVLYLINYFAKQSSLEFIVEDAIVIEDNVFLEDFTNTQGYKQWFSFNSYRKISALSDGSMIKTNITLDANLIENREAPFVEIKEDAKVLKYLFLETAKASLEEEYLQKFAEAEQFLDTQKKIYRISNTSIYRLQKEELIQKRVLLQERFLKVYETFKEYAIVFNAEVYTFAPLLLKNRDVVREKLRQRGIFLAVHWPKSTQNNPLYDTIISIPLFLHYDETTFNFMLKEVKEGLL